jgi:hypothetical protein
LLSKDAQHVAALCGEPMDRWYCETDEKEATMRAVKTVVLSVLGAAAALVGVIAVVKHFISPELHEKVLWSPLIEHRGRLSLLLAKIRAKKTDHDHQTPKETAVIALMTIFDLLLSRDQHYKYLWIQEQRAQRDAAQNGTGEPAGHTLPM